jgi:hypothetical protein
MRQPRDKTISAKNTDPIIISNQFSTYTPPLTLEGREVIRRHLYTCAKQHNYQIMAWCILPTSYRFILLANKIDKSRKKKIIKPLQQLADFSRSFQMRVQSWIEYSSDHRGSIWRERYMGSSLDTPGECIAATVCTHAFPILTGISNTTEDYFFTSYYHACAGDNIARQNISQIVGKPDTSWSSVKQMHDKLINECVQTVLPKG